MASEVAKAVKIALSGYYGLHNSGDEAVLLSILTALEQVGQEAGVSIEPVVLSGDPETTERLYGVRAAHRMRPWAVLRAIRSSDALISGGGSLLQDVTSCKTIPYYLTILQLAGWLRKPTFIYSQGIGPINHKTFYPYIRHVFSRATYISVRDQQSVKLLTRIGLQQKTIHVVPDPVIGLSLPSTPGVQTSAANSRQGFDIAGKPYVAVSLRFWNPDRSDMKAITKMLFQLSQMRAVHLRFLSFHGANDEQSSRYVMEKLKDNVFEVKSSRSTVCIDDAEHKSVMSLCPLLEHPQSMLKEVSQCRVLVGMRLHSLIYAASQEIPLAGISYDPKIDQFLNQLGVKAIGTTSTLDATQAASHICSLLDGADKWCEDRRRAIKMLKQKAGQPARQIVRRLRYMTQGGL